MEKKRLSNFVDCFFPAFIIEEHPKLVNFVKTYLQSTERYNQVKTFNVATIYPGDYDPEGLGRTIPGGYLLLTNTYTPFNKFAETEDLVPKLKGNYIKGQNIVKVENVVWSPADDAYLAVVGNTSSFAVGQDVAEVDIGEYTLISNLLLYRDIDETIEEFLPQHRSEYLSGIPSAYSGDLRLLIKKVREYYLSRGSEESFRFLFNAIFNSDVTFYYPKIDILRASDGKWYQPYVIQLDDETFLEELVDSTVRGSISGTIGDVNFLRTDIDNATRVAEFFTWTDLDDVVAESNGIRKTNSQGWNASAATTEEGGEGFGIDVDIPNNGYRLSLSLIDSTLPVTDQSSPGFQDGFTVATQNNQFLFYYNKNQISGLIGSYSGGDAISLRNVDGSIKFFNNNIELFTFPQTPPASLRGFAQLLTTGSAALADVRNSDRGTIISIPKFLEVDPKAGEFLLGEELININNPIQKGVITSVVLSEGDWTNNDGRLSSTPRLQDNFFYQDFSYVLRSSVPVAQYEQLVLDNIHPAGMKFFAEFIASDFSLFEIRLEQQQALVTINQTRPIGEIRLENTRTSNLSSTSLFDENITLSEFETEKENEHWSTLFNIGDLDGFQLGYFEDNPNARWNYMPNSELIVS